MRKGGKTYPQMKPSPLSPEGEVTDHPRESPFIYPDTAIVGVRLKKADPTPHFRPYPGVIGKIQPEEVSPLPAVAR